MVIIFLAGKKNKSDKNKVLFHTLIRVEGYLLVFVTAIAVLLTPCAPLFAANEQDIVGVTLETNTIAATEPIDGDIGISSDNPAFRQPMAVNESENDQSVYPAPNLVSVFDTSDLPDFDAEAYILIDRRTGQTICEKNADEQLYPASTTKIMTAILAIERGDLNEIMTASERAVRDIGPDGSNIGIIAGEKMRLDNLLDALLVRSANETANIIAENICDSRGEFIELMNEKANELGAYNTNFTNTSGFHEESHYTTAYDLSLIADYAMDNKTFREIVAKRSIALQPTNKHAEWDSLITTNQMLTSDTITGYTVTGIKTGYHSASGQCVVASGLDESTGMELLCVVMGVFGDESASSTRFQIAADLLSYGFENFGLNTLIKENELLGTIGVLGGDSIDTVDALSDGSVRIFLPLDSETWNISRIEYIKSEVAAPVVKGDVIGYVEFHNDNTFAGRVNVVAAKDIAAMAGGARDVPNRGNTGSAHSPISISDDTADAYRADTVADNGGNTAISGTDAAISAKTPRSSNSSSDTSSGNDSATGSTYDINGDTGAAGGSSDEGSGSDSGADSDSTDEADTNNGGVISIVWNILKIILFIIIGLVALILILRIINLSRRGKHPRNTHNMSINERLRY